MRVSIVTLLVAAGLVFPVGLGRADTAADALLDKAIKAHGGEEALVKYKGLRLRLKVILAGPDTKPKTWERLFLAPDKYKDVREGYYLGRRTASVNVTDGKETWTVMEGRAQLLEDKFAEPYKDDAHLMHALRLVPLKGKEYELKAVGETEVDGRTAAGLLVRTRGQKDVTLYFDADSGLLVKTERPVYDIYTEKEAKEERFFRDYPKKDALPYARKVLVVIGGRKDHSYEVSEVKFLEKVDEKEFRRK
jgi:hypothetical protein